jgi:hypothetical protein
MLDCNTYKLQIVQGTVVLKEIELPCYGEIKITSHDGALKTIETTIKEKLK